MIHTDDRRVLIDWNDSLPIKTCKIVKASKDCELGNHYHKKKTERFMLISGQATMYINEVSIKMQLNKPYIIPPKKKHRFEIKKDSILLCLVDKEYDSNDDFI